MFRACFATILSITLLLLWAPSARSWADTIQTNTINLPNLETPLEIPPVLVQPLHGPKEALSGLIKKKAALGTVILHLWAPNCAPCIPEIKTLEQMRPALEKQGLFVLTFAEDPDGMITVPAFILRHSIETSKDFYVDDTRGLLHALSQNGIPASFKLSPEGKIIAGRAGTVDWQALGVAR